MRRAIAALTIVGTFLFAGCENGCDEELIDEALEFVDVHQACESDDDCTVGHTGCSELPGTFCGQIALNRSGAESQKWKVLERELGECGSNECVQCAALLVPACVNGSCQRAQ